MKSIAELTADLRAKQEWLRSDEAHGALATAVRRSVRSLEREIAAYEPVAAAA